MNPYAAFQHKQSALLKAAALYFDKLYILDPEKATGDIGIGEVAKDESLLEQKDNSEREQKLLIFR